MNLGSAIQEYIGRLIAPTIKVRFNNTYGDCIRLSNLRRYAN